MLVPVDSPVHSPDKSCHWKAERVADSEKRGHRNRSARPDFLPVAGGESKANHILLAVSPVPPQAVGPYLGVMTSCMASMRSRV
jgi:hypothetical protein